MTLYELLHKVSFDEIAPFLSESYDAGRRCDYLKELIEKCTWTAEQYGYTVTGPNGNSIFLPACGMQGYKGAPRNNVQSGYYMTGNADVRTNYQGLKMTSNAATLRFSRGALNKFNKPEASFCSKAGGIQVRPVHQ